MQASSKEDRETLTLSMSKVKFSEIKRSIFKTSSVQQVSTNRLQGWDLIHSDSVNGNSFFLSAHPEKRKKYRSRKTSFPFLFATQSSG